MITPNQWQLAGIWGDERTPDLSFQQYPLFGIRISPLISLAPAVAALGGIGAAAIWWAGNFPKHTAVEVYTRLDEETAWNRVEKGQFLPGISSKLAAPESRSIQVQIVLRTLLSELNPDLTPEFDELVLVVYPNDREWCKAKSIQLTWRDYG